MAPRKKSPSPAQRYTNEEDNALYLALKFYNSHRDVRATKIQKLKDGRSRSVTTVGISEVGATGAEATGEALP